LRDERFTVGKEEDGLRLDSFLSLQPDLELSRSYLAALIRNGHVLLRGEAQKPSARVRAGDEVLLSVPDPATIDLTPEPMDLDVAFEDAHLLVVMKQANLVVHPTSTAPSGTLVHGLLAHCDDLSGIAGDLRPGIVHRLDKDTTGLMVVAKDDVTHQGLSAQLADRSMGRRYLAMVWHCPSPPEGRIDRPIGRDPAKRKRMAIVRWGRRAVTNYSTLCCYSGLAALVECKLETGRTHQIRVHLSAELGCPVIGDRTYGGVTPKGIEQTRANRELVEEVKNLAGHQMLHAETLRFIHPVTMEEMEFHAAPPMSFRLVQKRLERFSDTSC
jgi:23S rRNA pseudouridine1911/1915/1917 synthase